MTEENKAIARRVYEIISTGDFDRAGEIVDTEAPDNELLPGDPPARLIETFRDTFTEARDAFPDLSVAVEDVMAEGDRVVARVTMRGTHRGECTDGEAGEGKGNRHVSHLGGQDRGALGSRRRPEQLPARPALSLSE